MKIRTRSDPVRLRAFARLLRLERGGERVNLPELIQQLEDAATDVECMAEDLEMERDVTRQMAADLAMTRPPGGFKG